MNQDTMTRIINKKAIDMGYYTSADIIRAQDDIADSIIEDNSPVDRQVVSFDSYLDKINYIVACGYAI